MTNLTWLYLDNNNLTGIHYPLPIQFWLQAQIHLTFPALRQVAGL